jgi:hypothetical protein
MDLTPFLASSRAADAFKTDALAYSNGDPAARIRTARHNPTVKVLRLIAQLLHAEASLPIERIHIDAWSGCAEYTGTVEVQAGGTLYAYEFSWSCRWRAEQEGWIDCFGFPDQSRAADTFGWRCFERWRPLTVAHRQLSGR